MDVCLREETEYPSVDGLEKSPEIIIPHTCGVGSHHRDNAHERFPHCSRAHWLCSLLIIWQLCLNEAVPLGCRTGPVLFSNIYESNVWCLSGLLHPAGGRQIYIVCSWCLSAVKPNELYEWDHHLLSYPPNPPPPPPSPPLASTLSLSLQMMSFQHLCYSVNI